MRKYNVETKKEIVKLVLEEKMSYREIEKKYKVPRNTAFNWVCKYKEGGSFDALKPQRVKKEEIDYKEQYEIIKKFQAFLKKQQEKKQNLLTR